MSSARPSRALLAKCGSAICPRTMETRSAWLADNTASAFSGVRIWLSAITKAWVTAPLSTSASSAPNRSG